MIISFEELILTCAEGNAKSHMREAIRCYESSAYRAAIVSAYVSICFDLIDKLHALAASGDGEANRLVTELARLQTQQAKNDPHAVAGLLTFERNLLDIFRDKFEFFGTHEYEGLARLRHDRNQCAHPTFFQSSEPYRPSPELARLHIRNAIEFVLSQPPKQGKAALESLRATILSDYFPDKSEAVVARLRGTELSNPRPNLLTAFVDDLCFGAATKGHPLYSKVVVIRVLAAVVEMDRARALPRIISNTQKLFLSADESAIKLASSIAFMIAEVAESLNESTRTVLATWLSKTNEPSLGGAVARALKVSWLKAQATAAVDRLEAEHIGRLSGEIPPEIVSRAATLYASATNWTKANHIASQCLLPNVARLTEQDIVKILDASRAGNADLKGSHGFNDFIELLYEKSPLGPKRVTELLVEHAHQTFVQESPETSAAAAE